MSTKENGRKIYHIVYSVQIRDERCIFFLKNPAEP